jgi:hypothetical protein
MHAIITVSGGLPQIIYFVNIMQYVYLQFVNIRDVMGTYANKERRMGFFFGCGLGNRVNENMTSRIEQFQC